MKPMPAWIVAVVVALGADAHAEVTLIDNHKTVEVDCAKDPEIHVVGNHLTVTTRGVCARIAITGNHGTVTGSAGVVHIAGNHNTVTLAAADDVTVDGNNNTVAVRKPVKLKAPRIADAGTDNHITQPR